MDLRVARMILELPKNFTENMLKKQYHKLSLKYHPDKNRDNDTTNKFQEINEAYETLHLHLDIKNEKSTQYQNNYTELLKQFLKLTLTPKLQDSILNYVIQILTNYNSISHELNALPREVLINCFTFLKNNRDTINVTNDILDKLEKLINNTDLYNNSDISSQNQVVIIKPSLHDLFVSNVCRFEFNSQTYFVPMWHSEVVFDLDNKRELIIKCIPEIDDHLSIDSDNNLHIYLKTSISTILQNKKIEFKILNETLTIPSFKLNIIKNQIYVLERKGISKINDLDIYDDSEKADIIVHVELY